MSMTTTSRSKPYRVAKWIAIALVVLFLASRVMRFILQ
jgi:hypothetical protein